MEMRDTDLKILTSIGLSKTESIIYLDLVRNSESSVVEIAMRTKFHRPNVYDSIRRLKQRGIISEIVKEGKNLFSASKPERLNMYANQIGNNLKKFIDDLKKIPKIKEKEEVSICEGVIAIKAEMLSFLKTKKAPLNVLGNCGCLQDKIFLRKFHKERIKKKIPLRMIFCSEDKETMKRINDMPYSEARYLAMLKDFKLSTIIADDTVYYLINKKDSIIQIKIKHKDIAKEQKLHFDNAWNKAKVV